MAASSSRVAESVTDRVPSPLAWAPPPVAPLRKGKEVQTVTVAIPSAVSASDPAQSKLDIEISSGGSYRDRFDFTSTKLLLQNYETFASSGIPSRMMYLLEKEVWIDFSELVVPAMRHEFTVRKAMTRVWIGESRYLFDFTRMIQIDCETENCWSISWIDEHGKCFFPKICIGKEESIGKSVDDANVNGNRKIEVVIKLDENSLKRSREEFQGTPPNPITPIQVNPDPVTLPAVAENVPQTVEVSRWPKGGTKLGETDRDHQLIKNYFLFKLKDVDAGAKVTSIYKCTCERTFEKTRYELCHKQIGLVRFLRGPDAAKTRYAWHGASQRDVEKILAYRFMAPTKVPASDFYGYGAYLSPCHRPELSAKLAEVDENGEKHVLFCEVLVGNMEKLEKGSNQDHSSGVMYDTGSDNPNNPNWHVVWCYNMNTHILPEFVVSYKPSVVEQSSRDDPWLEACFIKAVELAPGQVLDAMNIVMAWKGKVLSREECLRRMRLTVRTIVRAILTLE